ncbi:MAG: Gfo/Idh/MocA family oxidoreductase [Planctomycetes bacterium]|nr:Gfo/Idh/MocA family oxidoreductase [Planctomycetota bacterium]
MCAMDRLTRRRFLAAAGAAVAAPHVVPASAMGLDGAAAPSDRIVLGSIGFGPRGSYDLRAMIAEKDVQYVAICDVRRDRREAAKKLADATYGNADCRMYRDLRELAARPDIDAVLVATGDRWHTPASILCAKAGKDVYSEKPCGLTIGQCQDFAAAMTRHGRVFQGGTQRRSSDNFRFAVHLARSGKLGRLRTLHASVYRPRNSHDWLPAEPEPPRDECDWDLWLGPAPWRPYNRRYVDGGWRGYDDFDSGATLLDWGAHTVDLCQWANQADHTTPVEFQPTPANITARYANGVGLLLDFLDTPFGNRDPQYRTSTGTCPVRFEGDEAWVETGDSGEVAVSRQSLLSERNRFVDQGINPANHARNFLDCVKSRAWTACNQNIMRRSHIACHAAALAWMLGRKLIFDPVKEEFVGDDEANRMRTRAMREPWHT